MEFRLLGRVEADREGRRLDLGRRRERCLLALLLLTPDRGGRVTTVPAPRAILDELGEARVAAVRARLATR